MNHRFPALVFAASAPDLVNPTLQDKLRCLREHYEAIPDLRIVRWSVNEFHVDFRGRNVIHIRSIEK